MGRAVSEIPPYPLLASHSHGRGRDTSKGPANPHKLPYGVPMGLHLAHVVGAEEACGIDHGPGGWEAQARSWGRAWHPLPRNMRRRARKGRRMRSKVDAGVQNLATLNSKLPRPRPKSNRCPRMHFRLPAPIASYWGSVSALAAAKKETEGGDKMDVDTPEKKSAMTNDDGDDRRRDGNKKRIRFEDDVDSDSRAAELNRWLANNFNRQHGHSNLQVTVGWRCCSMSSNAWISPGFLPFPHPRDVHRWCRRVSKCRTSCCRAPRWWSRVCRRCLRLCQA